MLVTMLFLAKCDPTLENNGENVTLMLGRVLRHLNPLSIKMGSTNITLHDRSVEDERNFVLLIRESRAYYMFTI